MKADASDTKGDDKHQSAERDISIAGIDIQILFVMTG
jgi:hypothetical protein